MCVSTIQPTDVVIDKPTAAGTYTYYFTAVPVDALGNSAAAAALNSIDYQRDADTSNVDDGTNVTGDVTARSEVSRSWPWGVIAGVVFAALHLWSVRSSFPVVEMRTMRTKTGITDLT